MKHHTFLSLLLLAASAATSFAVTGTAIPGGNQSAPFIINKPGAYYLAASRTMTDGSKNNIEIAATDVTLDLNGNVLSFAAGTQGSAHLVYADSPQNLEIGNGSLANSVDSAVYIKLGQGVRIINLRVASTAKGYGIYSSAAGTLIQGCSVSSSSDGGVYCTGESGVVRQCVVRETVAGWGIAVGGNSTVVDSAVENCSGNGVLAQTGCLIQNNHISNTNLSHNTFGGGINVTDVCTIRGNVISENYNSIVAPFGLAFVEENTVISDIPGAAAFINLSGGSNRCLYRNNRFLVLNGNVTVGSWTNGGGNLTP